MATNFLTAALPALLAQTARRQPAQPAAQQVNPFDQFDAAPAAPVALRERSPVPEMVVAPQPPRPQQAPPRTPDQARKDAADAATQGLPEGMMWSPDGKSAIPIPGVPPKAGAPGAPATPQAMEEARQEALAKVKLARTLRQRSKEDWFTGGGWQTLANVPFVGQRQFDFSQDAETLKNAAALQRIMEMSAANGGKNPLTPLSNADFKALATSLTNLDPGQSDEQFQNNLDVIEDLYKRMYQGAGGVDLEKDLAPPKPDDTPPPPATGAADAPESAAKAPPTSIGIDRSTIPTADEGQGTPQASTKVKTVEDPWLKRHGPKIGLMLSGGIPDDKILAYMRENGAPENFRIQDQLAWRRTPAFRLWKQQNPRAAWRIDPNVEVPLNEAEAADATLAASPVGSFVEGVSRVPLSAAMGAAALAGQGEWADDMERRRQIMRAANAPANIAGNLVGAVFLPGPKGLPGMIGSGAGYSAVDAFGSTQGDVGERFSNALAGGASGALLSGAIGGATRLPKVLPARRLPGGEDAQALAEAARAEGVPLSRPIIDPSRRTPMAYLESSIGGGGPVQRSLRATEEALESRAGEIAGRGAPQTPDLMGQRAQDAMRRDLTQQRAQASKIYDRASELSSTLPVYGQQIVQELDTELAKLGRNPNSNRALINYLESVRGDFINADGRLVAKTVDDIRQIRTNLAADLNTRNLTRTPAERIISRALDKGRRDIERDLLDGGPKGAQARDLYREGDVRWKLAKRDEKQVVERLLGPADNPISGKATMDRAMQWLNNGTEGRSQAARFWSKLNPTEKQDFAATVASSWGRRAPDEPFSPALFVANTRSIPPSSRRLLFGEEGARSIANLRALSRAYSDSISKLNNSRSGVVQNWNKFINSVTRHSPTVGGMGGGAIGGVPGAIAGAAAGSAITGSMAYAHNLAARALMNPDLTRWLANAPRQTEPGAIRRYIDKLPGIAAKQPGIADEVLGLRTALLNSLSGSKASENDAAQAPDREQ